MKKQIKKRAISKILKLDENNQYGNGMTEPLLTGFIKDDCDICWEAFNFLLEKVDFEDTIGPLYIVDIEFGNKNATKREVTNNKIYPPTIEKKKLLIHVKDLYFNYQNNISKEKKVQNLRNQQLKHMQTF